jgi:Na+/H+ antiporter NhaC
LLDNEAFALVPKPGVIPRASNMLVPMAVLIVVMVIGMLITGHGRFADGEGSTSVFFAVLAAVAVGVAKYRFSKIMRFDEILGLFFKSVGGMAGMAFLLTFSFALSRLCLDMKTGPFVASATNHIVDPKFVPVILSFCGVHRLFRREPPGRGPSCSPSVSDTPRLRPAMSSS